MTRIVFPSRKITVTAAPTPAPAPTPTPAPTPAPAGTHWSTDQNVGEWRKITGSAMSNTPPTVNPGRAAGGPSLKLTAWCGLAIDTRTTTLWSLGNGGHDDYHGNEVMKLNLSDNSPVWVEVTPSTPASAFATPYDASVPNWQGQGNLNGYYPDGRPTSAHTYYQHQFVESLNRAMRMGNGASSTVGNPCSNVDGFNCNAAVGTNGWDPAGTYPRIAVAYAGIPTCKNPATEDIYIFLENYYVQKWSPSSPTQMTTVTTNPPNSFYGCASAFDSTRNRIFLLGGTYSECRTFDVSAVTFAARSLSGPAAGSVPLGPQMGMIYEPTLDAYLVRRRPAGGAVYKINASTFEVTQFTTTGGDAIELTGFLDNGAGGSDNVFNRFLYAPLHKGVVYVPHYSSDAWFLKTHA